MKRIWKIIPVTALCVIMAVLAAGLLRLYQTQWKLTDIGVETSPDGNYRVLFQEKGEPDFPFGYTHSKVTLYDSDGTVIQTFQEDIADDGARFSTDNYSVEWDSEAAYITFMGSEQEDRQVMLPYDGSEDLSR